MRPGAIRQVKKEIRVLGITARPSHHERSFQVVGVVFRGSLWLDGVIRTESHDPNLTESIIEMVKGSPHHPQIRVLLLSEHLIKGNLSVDPYRILSEVQRPVILPLSEGNQAYTPVTREDFETQRFKLKRGTAPMDVVSFGLTSREVERVFSMSTRTGALPEALRVAELVADAVAKCAQQNV